MAVVHVVFCVALPLFWWQKRFFSSGFMHTVVWSLYYDRFPKIRFKKNAIHYIAYSMAIYRIVCNPCIMICMVYGQILAYMPLGQKIILQKGTLWSTGQFIPLIKSDLPGNSNLYYWGSLASSVMFDCHKNLNVIHTSVLVNYYEAIRFLKLKI